MRSAAIRNIFKHALFRVALVALLLFAQQEAFTHDAGHALDHTLAQSQQSSTQNGSDSGSGKSLHSGLCDFHAAFASVLGLVHTTTLPVILSVAGSETVPVQVVFAAPTRPIIRAARGPPVPVLS
jgi:hypothetical protein